MMLIDDREPDWIKNHSWEFQTKVQRLPVGDFLIPGGIIVERKEINDFVKSLKQHMWEQLIDLEENIEDDSNDYTVAALLVHGSVPDLNSRNMEPRKIQGIYGGIARIIVSYGVPVIWVREKTQAIKILNKLHAKGGTETDRKKPHLTKRRYRDDRYNLLAGIKGLGRSTIGDILAADNSGFNTVAEVANASEDRLQEVPGVGPKTASRIRDAFHASD